LISPLHTPRILSSAGSISPRLASTTSPSSYSHNPYTFNQSKIFHQSFTTQDGLSQHSDSSSFPSPAVGAEFPAVEFDETTLTLTIPELSDQHNAAQSGRTMHHTSLSGFVPHVPFPTEAFVPPTTQAPKDQLSRIFIGQLPYNATDMEICWLFWHFAGIPVFHIERIVQWRKNRQPSGCVHAYVFERDRIAVMSLDHTLLFDDCGVWVAETSPQRRQLEDYCSFLSDHRESRPFQRPYQMVRVQEAVSTYHPKQGAAHYHPAAGADSSAPARFNGINAAASRPMRETHVTW